MWSRLWQTLKLFGSLTGVAVAVLSAVGWIALSVSVETTSVHAEPARAEVWSPERYSYVTGIEKDYLPRATLAMCCVGHRTDLCQGEWSDAARIVRQMQAHCAARSQWTGDFPEPDYTRGSTEDFELHAQAYARGLGACLDSW